MLLGDTRRRAEYERLLTEFEDARRDFDAMARREVSSTERRRIRDRLSVLRSRLREWREAA